MIYATRIHMFAGCQNSYNCQEIDTIYLVGVDEEKFYKKSDLYDYLQKKPDAIRVNLGERPSLKPALSSRNEKYVRSEPNDTSYDNLLQLPRG